MLIISDPKMRSVKVAVISVIVFFALLSNAADTGEISYDVRPRKLTEYESKQGWKDLQRNSEKDESKTDCPKLPTNVPRKDACGLHQQRMVIKRKNCVPKRITLMVCKGSCASEVTPFFQYSDSKERQSRMCEVCKPLDWSIKKIKLTCFGETKFEVVKLQVFHGCACAKRKTC